ncbi:MAG TPA: histidine kinase, partial [Luteolibacter sp.]
MTDDSRPDPDALLAQMRREESQEKRGRLFLFFGMCPGVGKTYAMLLAARQRQSEGLSVLVGVVETHGRVETEELLEGLDVLPRKKLPYGAHVLEEFDLDEALKRRPDLLLVDELAHTNAPGSRHRKRYQDVMELLDAGIDVCSTLNVQHIESQIDTVRQITGVAVRETVPDSILDRAQEIQLIDLSVEKLKERLTEGKVYLGERAEVAKTGFFRETNLTALRELALRFTAEHVDRDLEDLRREKKVSSPWKTHARLMVGVAPSPYSESLVRWTRRAAGRIGCPWLAVWVERTQPLSSSEQELLGRSLTLARNLGGEVVHATGDDVAATLLDTARDRNVSQIVVGKPDRWRWWK